jgi:hypothetical protein
LSRRQISVGQTNQKDVCDALLARLSRTNMPDVNVVDDVADIVPEFNVVDDVADIVPNINPPNININPPNINVPNIGGGGRGGGGGGRR